MIHGDHEDATVGTVGGARLTPLCQLHEFAPDEIDEHKVHLRTTVEDREAHSFTHCCQRLSHVKLQLLFMNYHHGSVTASSRNSWRVRSSV